MCHGVQLEAEAKIPASAKFWCPQKDCSRLLVVQKSTHREVECIACGTYLCTACRSFGHVGMTCAEAKVSCQLCTSMHICVVGQCCMHCSVIVHDLRAMLLM